ncbi:CHAT domain-containing protein [Ekhidna sp. MALMAid0563]|uniref:CHAT domain-containing protein n=1 Tax=Ekhidna sp. MALMAid0563 TaxID=3143937 RepID=UPI0032DE5748
MFRIAAVGLILILSFHSSGQTCLQKLDSANYFKYDYPLKAKFYANSLLTDLDSGNCVTEIGLAGLYNNVGLVLWEVNDRQRSLTAFQNAISYEVNNQDSIQKDLLGIYYNLSALYQELGKFNEAGKYLDLAGRVTERAYADDPKAQVRYYFAQGVYHREVGNFEESLDALNQAIELGSYNDSIRMSLQIELGTTFRDFGDLGRSETELLKAVEMAKGKNEIQYLRAIDRLSALKIEQGEYSDSENYLLYNLEQKEEKYNNDPIVMLETLNGLSGLYYRLNDLKSANDYMTRALDVAGDIRTIRPYMINNLGTIYKRQGDIEKAEECFKESSQGFLGLFGSMNPDYANSLSNLASIYKEKGDLGKALDLYMKVLDMDKVIYGTEHANYATSLNNVALLYLQFGNFSLAGKLLQDAKRIRAHTLGNYHPLYIKTVNDLGLYYMIVKDYQSAMESFDHALDAEIKHMQDIFPVLTDKQRKLYFDETRYNIERFCSLAFKGDNIYTEYAENALNHFLNTRGILFYASEKMRRLIQNSDDSKIKRDYNTWREKKYSLAQAYLLTEEDRIKQGISITHLEEECAQLEKDLARKFKVFADQERTTYHHWGEISNSLGDSTAMIDVIQYRNYTIDVIDEEIEQGFEDQSRYVAFIIKDDSTFIPVRLDVDQFDKAFASYRNSLKFGIKDKLSYGVFWKPLDEQLGDINKIYLSPDGIFHKLNPVVFFDASTNAYMADKYNIINITSGKDLLYREDQSLVTDAKIFGNPDFSKIEGYSLKQLPGAEREASDISEILDVRRWKTETYYFSEATEDKIKSFSNPGIIHIATHGYFIEDPNHTDPLHSSGLFLSKSESSENDGLLSAYEAMNLVLDETNLVVLAACETGLGKVQNGEGVFGLQRSFLVAGSQNVLLSLVKINDQAARNFMNLFYKQLLVEKDPQQAFFNARTEFRKIDSNPYNWGAYILVSKG